MTQQLKTNKNKKSTSNTTNKNTKEIEDGIVSATFKIWESTRKLVPIEFISNFLAMHTFITVVEALPKHLHKRVFDKLNESLDKERKKLTSVKTSCCKGVGVGIAKCHSGGNKVGNVKVKGKGKGKGKSNTKK